MTASPSEPEPSIKAEPREIPFGFGPAETVVRWDARPDVKAVVRVARDDGAERTLSVGPRGEKAVDWIQSGSSYFFRLYSSTGELLDSTEVRRAGAGDAGSYVAALRDPSLYAAAAVREHEYWGRALTDPQRAERRAAAYRAGAELRIYRDHRDLLTELKQLGATPARTLSLGCGEGGLERGLLGRGLGGAVEAIDISEDAVAAAQRQADAAGLPISYRVADLNVVDLPAAAYDLVIAQNGLHHLLQLEHLLDEVKRALRPGALLWIDDFVGESQFQWLDARIEISRRLIESLPEPLRWDAINDRPVMPPVRMPPGSVGSPFESLRSAEIPVLLRERFEVVASHESGTILRFVAPPGTHVEYARTPENRERFERLFALDRLLCETGALPPLHGQYLVRV